MMKDRTSILVEGLLLSIICTANLTSHHITLCQHICLIHELANYITEWFTCKVKRFELIHDICHCQMEVLIH